MAWTCTACRVLVPFDTDGCPQCGTFKDSWTVLADKTRAFAVELKKFEVWRATGTEPVPPGDARLAPQTLVVEETSSAIALPKGAAAGLAAKGLVPAPCHLLVLRTYPKADKAPTAVLTVNFTAQAAAEHEVTTNDPALHQGRFDLLYALVYGAGDPPALDGVHVIDITDPDAKGGHAPEVTLTGFKKKKARTLPVRALARPRFVFSR